MLRKQATTKTATRSNTITRPKTSVTNDKQYNGGKRMTLVNPADIDGKIRAKAYELFLQRGAYHGDDMADWFKAEKEVKREYSLA